jgi:hypothetical protein
MPDIYVGVGPMDYNTDTTKVALKYAINAKEQMKNAATAAIKAQPGFTVDKAGSSRQYDFNATLTEVVFSTRSGQPAVTCKLTADLSTPNKFAAGKNDMVSAKILGTATLIGGTTDRDVADCIAAAVTKTVNDSVIPGIKTHMKNNP